MSKTDRLAVAFGKIEWQDAASNSRILRKQKSRELAYTLLSELFKLYGEDISLLSQITRTSSGRPFIPESHIDFNISHSGEYVAVAVSFNQPKRAVGIDLEHPQKTRRFIELLNHYADPNDVETLLRTNYLPQLDSLEKRFYLDWCLREAVLKSQGVGIVKLSEVRHHVEQRQIKTPHSPKGQLLFYHQLPFFLACFVESNQMPKLYQWQDKQLEMVENIQPLIHQVN